MPSLNKRKDQLPCQNRLKPAPLSWYLYILYIFLIRLNGMAVGKVNLKSSRWHDQTHRFHSVPLYNMRNHTNTDICGYLLCMYHGYNNNMLHTHNPLKHNVRMYGRMDYTKLMLSWMTCNQTLPDVTEHTQLTLYTV